MELSVIQGIMQIKQGVMVFANNTLQYLLGFFSSFDCVSVYSCKAFDAVIWLFCRHITVETVRQSNAAALFFFCFSVFVDYFAIVVNVEMMQRNSKFAHR